jgi:hypothetical protein
MNVQAKDGQRSPVDKVPFPYRPVVTKHVEAVFLYHIL